MEVMQVLAGGGLVAMFLGVLWIITGAIHAFRNVKGEFRVRDRRFGMDTIPDQYQTEVYYTKGRK